MKSSSNKQGSHANDLLRRWLADEAEAQEVQQAAQDDAFLQEALEGYQAFAKKEQLERLTKVRAKLQDRYQQKEKRRVLFYLPRIAAAIVVLVALGWWWTTLSTDMTTDSLANQTTPTTEEPVSEKQLQRKGDEASIAPQEETEETFSEIAQAETTADKNPEQPQAEVLTQVEPTQPATALAPSTDLDNSGAARQDISEPLAEAAEEVIEESAIAFDEEPVPQSYDATPRVPQFKSEMAESERFSDRMAVRSTVPQRFIQGTVLDATGKPVIGANVIANEQTGTVTDAEGRFALTVPPTESLLTVTYSGFIDERVSIIGQDSVAIKLAEQTPINKLIISDYAGDTPQANRDRKASPMAMPKDGSKKFEKYIRKNLRFPEAAQAANVQLDIPVYFTVNPDGTVTNVRVPAEKQDDYGLAKEAIRLIEEGPKWNSYGQTIQDMLYVVKFGATN